MKTICFHLILALEGRRVLVPDVAARRALVTIVAALIEPYRIFLFNAPDTHLHLAAQCARAAAGRLVSSLSNALRHALGIEVPFRPAEIIPVFKQSHLAALPGYILGQRDHHGVLADPFHEGSAVLDHLGLRCIATEARPILRSLLPRLTRDEILPHLGVRELRAGSAPHLLAESAASAFALPSLEGRSPRALAAKSAAIAVGRDLGLKTERVADLLDLSVRTVQRLTIVQPPARAVQAVRFQMGLRERAGAPVRP